MSEPLAQDQVLDPQWTRRGQALVELALVLPIMLSLLMGVVEVGRIVFTYIALEDAAQEGSIYAAHQSVPENAIRARVLSSSNHTEVTGATVEVICTITPAPGTVSVRASYDLPLITPLGAVFGGTFHLDATKIGTNFKETC